MEREIDLRPYVEAVVNKWIWVVGTAAIFALIALGISFLIQPVYEATALVAITNPRQIVQFDPRIRSSDEDQPYKAYPELAKSDELLTTLLNELQQSVPEVTSLENLGGILQAEAGSDPSILRLSVKFEDPQTAADIANTWAALFVAKANEVFGLQGSDQLSYFNVQLTDAARQLEEAETEFIEFQAGNRATILESELIALQETQAAHLAKQRQITSVSQDAKSLQEQLEGTGRGNSSSPADQLAAVLLQLRAFSGDVGGEIPAPWQLQVNLEQISGSERDDQIAFLVGLQEALAAQSTQIVEDLAQLEPQILSVQQEKQEAEVHEARLTRDLEIAEGTYTALALKVEEEQITSQNTGSGVRLASQSAVPNEPTRQSRILLIAIAMILGAMLSVAIIIITTWWRS